MASNRSLRIFEMAQERQTTQDRQVARELVVANYIGNTLIPSYESTKGTTSFEQELAIRGCQQLENERQTAELIRKAVENEIKTLTNQNYFLENYKNVSVAEESITTPIQKHIQQNKIKSTGNGKDTEKNSENLINKEEKNVVNKKECLRSDINADMVSKRYKGTADCNEIDNNENEIKPNDMETVATITSVTLSNRKTTAAQMMDNERSITPEHDITSTSSDKHCIINTRKYAANQDKNYDSVSECKTSGSEYVPSDDSSGHVLCDTCSSDTSNHNNDIYFKIRKKDKGKRKRQARQISKTRLSKPNTHVRQLANSFIRSTPRSQPQTSQYNYFDENEPSSSQFKQGTRETKYISDSGLGQETVTSTSKNATCSRSNSKIKIISNIQVNPPTNINNRADSTTMTAPAESTIESYDKTPSSTNLVKISAAKKTTKGKRVRDKKHSCYFCHIMILHIARHMEIKHGKEMDVARALAFPKKSDKRKELFSEITRAGDFHYNCEVLSLKQGELILVRRPTRNEIIFHKYRDYGPCPNCLGFLLKKHLWHHLKTKCSKKYLNDQSEDPEQANRQIIAESNAILSNVFGTEISRDYQNYIVNTLRDDEVGNCCREDNLILKFGGMQFEKYGTTQCEFIRQNMRQLARLTLTIRKLTLENLKLFDLLTPQKFDLVVQGVKELCQRHQNDSTKRPEFMTPSLALKLGHSLKKCANMERGLALRQENMRRNESLLAFCNILDMEWQVRISSNALATLYMRKLNAGQLLPVTSDLMKLNSYIKTGIEQAQTELIKSPTAANWSRLAKFILCRIILFNKRRAGEASRMTLEQYTTRPAWSQHTNDELKTALTPYEIKLAESHVIVNIIGKRGRIVPVLLTPEAKLGLDVLISHRGETVGVNLKNPYVFARGLQVLTYMRGSDVLRQIIMEINDLEKPDLITSTKLRKYIATVCQVFDLTENEYDWLARHLGHDIKVHRQFYRLHEDVVELTKVSRLLLAVDTGEANKFAGRQLKDINLADLPPIEEEDDPNEEDDDLQKIATDAEIAEEAFKNTNLPQEQRYIPESFRQNSSEIGLPPKLKQNRRPIRDSVTGINRSMRSSWDIDDKKAVLAYFRVQIKNGIVPGKTDCEACQAKYTSLKDRKWTDIKFCVKNQISKIKKMQTG